MISINSFDPMTLLLFAALNPVVIVVAFLMGRKADQWQKIPIAALAASIAGVALFWLGGQVGVADHVRIGDGARLAARTGVTNSLEGGADYGGIPAKPVKQWARELAAVSMLVKRSKKKS